jgi:hypothetical protein
MGQERWKITGAITLFQMSELRAMPIWATVSQTIRGKCQERPERGYGPNLTHDLSFPNESNGIYTVILNGVNRSVEE